MLLGLPAIWLGAIAILGQMQSIADLQPLVIKVKDGQPVWRRDVAEVKIGSISPKTGKCHNGQPDVDIPTTTQGVEAVNLYNKKTYRENSCVIDID